MIFNLKTLPNIIRRFFFLLFLTNLSASHAHNFFNGGCNHHCQVELEIISNKNKLKITTDQKEIESNNSCLKKSLCRG